MPNSPLRCEVVNDFAPDWEVPQDAGIIITHMHYRWEEIHALRNIYESGQVPILILADGILEYRNIWEHPELADGCIFQPIIGHKLATIGQGQTRVVESWGNVGKCETVGLPRFDSWFQKKYPPIRTRGALRLLIATANTPAFDEAQRRIVIESLIHIRDRVSKNSRVNGRPIEVVWRLTDGLEQDLELPEPTNGKELPPLSEVIDQVDAVITTPSTVFLESVIKKRPTALLDFHNAPQYIRSAWTISAPKNFNDVVRELADPPASKMLFQETELRDQLRSDGPACNRMIELIYFMVEEGIAARSEQRPIELPHRIIETESCGFNFVPHSYNLHAQYPENSAFQLNDIDQLKLELSAAIKRLEGLPKDLNEKRIALEAQAQEYQTRVAEIVDQNKSLLNLNAQLRGRNSELMNRVSELMDRVAELRDRLNRLLSRLGQEPPKRSASEPAEQEASTTTTPSDVANQNPATSSPPSNPTDSIKGD